PAVLSVLSQCSGRCRTSDQQRAGVAGVQAWRAAEHFGAGVAIRLSDGNARLDGGLGSSGFLVICDGLRRSAT
ncbi:MAG: hypothetical protein VXX01_04785, partial [Pseudomonadota bacterium]|nr:hypothetical protein [Pseudomonadota bacterium]